MFGLSPLVNGRSSVSTEGHSGPDPGSRVHLIPSSMAVSPRGLPDGSRANIRKINGF